MKPETKEAIEKLCKSLGATDANVSFAQEWFRFFIKHPEILALEGYQKAEWVSVEDRLPKVDNDDEWNKKVGQSKEVWTYSDFGMRQGRYYYHSKHWTVNGVTSSRGINVTYWIPLPTPPKQY